MFIRKNDERNKTGEDLTKSKKNCHNGYMRDEKLPLLKMQAKKTNAERKKKIQQISSIENVRQKMDTDNYFIP